MSLARVRKPARAECRGQVMSKQRRAARSQPRGWISRHAKLNGVQARMKVNGTPLTKAFSVSVYGSVGKAEVAARAWLAAVARELPSRYATALRSRPSPRKTRPALPIGVTESHMRLRSGVTATRIQVVWHDGYRRRSKSFWVGTEKTATTAGYRAAVRQATAFRRAYVACRQAGLVFDPADDL